MLLQLLNDVILKLKMIDTNSIKIRTHFLMRILCLSTDERLEMTLLIYE